MTELRRPRPEDTYIWPDTVWAETYRAMLAEITYAMAWQMVHATDSGSLVVGGLEWSNPAGLTTRIGRGWALVYDGTVVAPGPKWKVVYVGANADDDHDARHATLDRVDAVSLSYALTNDNAETLGRSGVGAPASTYTQAGSVATLVLTAGTAHASSWANKGTAPAGNLLLGYVKVPSTADGGAITFIDAREFAPGPTNRPIDRQITWHGDTDDTQALLLKVAARAASTAATSWLSLLSWDMAEDWPMVTRGAGAAGDQTGDFYPLMAQARTWERSFPLGFAGNVDYDSGSASDLSVTPLTLYTEIKRVSSGTVWGSVAWPLVADVRALEVADIKLVVKEQTAFNGTVTHMRFDLIVLHADGTSDVIGDHELASLTTGVQTTLVGTVDFDNWTPTLLASGDTLYCLIYFETTGNSAGEIRVQSCSITFREGAA